MKLERRAPLACISLSTSIWRGFSGPSFCSRSRWRYPPIIARGVLSSWAAEARASRQQLQCSSLKTSNFCRTEAIFDGRTATSPFLLLNDSDNDACALLGKILKPCSTGILSTKVSLGFSKCRVLGGKSWERSTRGRLDISSTSYKVNQNLRIIWLECAI